jgi:NAD(P) transhydrogenase subunit beta
MIEVFLSLAWVLASVLFVSSLRGLSHQETARRGNSYGMAGMAVAALAVVLGGKVGHLEVLVPAMLVGGALGATMAKRVAMTAMPELVAVLHSFVGLAAVLVGYAAYLDTGAHPAGHRFILRLEVWADVAIGAVTFTGSVVAFLKLRGSLSGRALLLPGRHALNAGAVLAVIGLAVPFVASQGSDGLPWLLAMTAVASLLGVHLVAAIGGADMPVVVSLLNSYSGWTASAAGFMLENDLLIITGALVGSSGAILSYIMCRAMNRSIWNVVFGGFGAEPSAPSKPSDVAGARPEGVVQEITLDELVDELRDAHHVVIVPGYGMAVARAQHAVKQLTDVLQGLNITARFAIHPVAGRLPGHMNVLLAEASVPYDIVLEMDEINQDLPRTDVVLVIGANDIVNPSAQTDPASPIAGMPVLEVWKARRVVVLKRSRASGYAGVDNPLFYLDNTRMLFADARDGMEKLVARLKA